MDNKIFWRWAENEAGNDANGERTLYMDGVIASETWFDDDITPKMFKDELFAGSGDVTIWLNSPGGDCIAASQIYAMLMEYKGNVTVKIDGLAASAASVVAMAGTKVLMAPTSLFMIHNPMTFAIGDSEEMRKARDMLDEVKESIINAYQIRTSLSREKLSNLMDAETWLSAHKAIELGFADGMLEDAKAAKPTNAHAVEGYAFSRRAVTNSLLDKLVPKAAPPGKGASGASVPETTAPPAAPEPPAPKEPETPQGIPVESLTKRLNLILNK